MSTEMFNPPAHVLARSKAHHLSPLKVAAFAIVVFHLVGGVMLDRSHASKTIEPLACAALDDDAKCSPGTTPPPPSLPYD